MRFSIDTEIARVQVLLEVCVVPEQRLTAHKDGMIECGEVLLEISRTVKA